MYAEEQESIIRILITQNVISQTLSIQKLANYWAGKNNWVVTVVGAELVGSFSAKDSGKFQFLIKVAKQKLKSLLILVPS